MSQGGWVSAGPVDPYYGQLLEDLADFRNSPYHEYSLPARDPATYTLDQTSVFLDDLFPQFPALQESWLT